MKRLLILTFICLISAFVKVQGKSSSTPIIYIDGNGVMRWSDTRREASFFGVNYTLPLPMPTAHSDIWDWTAKLP
mgnify:CR=1 FL=1